MGKNDNILDFLKSTRFWAAVLGAAATAMTQTESRLQIAAFLGSLSAAFITIRTVDRVTDKNTKK